jgi:MFS family permease
LILLSLTLAAYGSAYLRASLILASLGSLILLLFIYLELKSSSPALDLRIFRNWQFAGGIVAQFLYSLAFGSVTVLLVIYLSVVKGLSASLTGMLLLPFEFSFLIFGTLGGKLSDKYGYAPITMLGLALSSTSLYMMSLFSTQTSIRFIVATMLLLGCGAGLFVTPNASSIMAGAPQERRGVASSIRALSFNIGFAASLNLSVLLMTGFIPYDLASKLIAAELTNPIDLGNVNLLSRALSETFKFQSLIMASAMLFSTSRLPLNRAIRKSEKGVLKGFEVKDSSRASIPH